MTPGEKLVQQINHALTGAADRITVERLAREYTELCQATSRRLEQCEAMLVAGEHYQVIQLAETPPPVLDLVALLSFARSDDWRKLCQNSHLPVPDAFPERALARVNELYAKGITAGHSLYRDYRAAMAERNDERALGILRAIVKLNASDESAKAENQRLEQKVRDQKIATLDQLLQKRDVPAVLAALSSMEVVFQKAILTGPVIEQARAVRREQERQQALRHCEELIAGLAALRQANNWQKTLESTQNVESLSRQHGIELEPALSKQFTAARTWATAIKVQADQEQSYRESLQQFRTLVVMPQTQRRGPVRMSLKTALTELSNKRAELEAFGRPLTGELVSLAVQRETQLRRQLAQADKRHALLITGCVICGLVLLAVGLIWFNYERNVSATVATLQMFKDKRNVSGAQQQLDVFRQSAEVKAQPRRIQEMLVSLDAFIIREEQQQKEAATKIKGLEPYFNGALTNAPTAEISGKVQEAQISFNNVADELRGEMTRPLERYQYLLKSRQTIEGVHIENATRQRHKQLDVLLAEADSNLAQALELTNHWRVIQSRLQSIGQTLEQVATLVQTNDVEQKNQLTSLKAKLEPIQAELANLDTASRELRRAQTVDNYLIALAQFRSVHFNGLPELRAAEKVLAASNTFSDVAVPLLMPDEPEGWAAFKANPDADFYPSGEIQPFEANILLGLRDNENLRNIFRYDLPPSVASKTEIPLGYFFARGAFQPSSQVGAKLRFTANAFVPDMLAVQVAFNKINFTWDAKEIVINEPPGRLAPESRVFDTLALSSFVDPQSSKFRKSLLGVLDTLRMAKDISPVFRAYVQHQLFELMEVRRIAWGSAWVPTLKEHRKQLKEMDAGELQSADWMLPSRVTQWQGKLANFYQTAPPVSYLKLARFNRALVQGAVMAGFSYAGFIDSNGQALFTEEALKATEFWGLTKDDIKLGCVLRKGSPQHEPECVQPALVLTPLFFLKADRQALRRAAIKSAGVSETDIAAGDVLPPLFK